MNALESVAAALLAAHRAEACDCDGGVRHALVSVGYQIDGYFALDPALSYVAQELCLACGGCGLRFPGRDPIHEDRHLRRLRRARDRSDLGSVSVTSCHAPESATTRFRDSVKRTDACRTDKT